MYVDGFTDDIADGHARIETCVGILKHHLHFSAVGEHVKPVSALDVSIQAQVVNMFEDLQSDLGLTYLFIAHDLSVVKHISNRIGVMYLGKLVELADSRELISHSMHPYTKSLISAIPEADPKAARASHRITLRTSAMIFFVFMVRLLPF